MASSRSLITVSKQISQKLIDSWTLEQKPVNYMVCLGICRIVLVPASFNDFYQLQKAKFPTQTKNPAQLWKAFAKR